MKTKNLLLKSLYSLVLVISLVFVVACGGTTQPTTSLKFNETSYELFVGETKAVSLTAGSSINLADVVLSSSDETVVSVDGLTITALKTGYVTLTARHEALNVTATIGVTVKINKDFSFKQAVYEIEKGQSLYIEMNLESGIALEAVTFASADKTVAKFIGTRLVASKVGETTITATYGEYIAVAKVVVKLSAEELANIEIASKFDAEVAELLADTNNSHSELISKAQVLLEKLDTYEGEVLVLIQKDKELKAAIIDATISLLPEVVKYSDEKVIKAARDLYRNSDLSVRSYITKLSLLEAKEAELTQALAQYELDKASALEMDNIILSLPTSPTYTQVLEILKVNAQYEALAEDAKGLVKKYSTLKNILKKVVTLQENVENLQALALDFEVVVELLPEEISSDVQAELIVATLKTYLSLDELVKVHLSAEAYTKFESIVAEANRYYGHNAHLLSELESELESILEATPAQIIYDFEFAQTSLENATSTWEYAQGQDESIHDLTTGEHKKLALNVAKRTLVLTLSSGLVTLTKEVSIDFGVLANNQKGLFYNNDPKTLSKDESGTSTTLGWSGYTLSYGLYNMFVLAGNVFEISSAEELSNATIANPLYSTAIINRSNEKLTINFIEVKDKVGNTYFGNSAIVIREGEVVANYKQASKVTLLPGECLYSTKETDASSIANNFLAPASSLKVGTKIAVKNWNEVKNPYLLEQQANYLVVNKHDSSAYQTITAALAAAKDGDTIFVYAGDYSIEEITISKAVTLLTFNENISSLAYKKAATTLGSVTIAASAKVSGFTFTKGNVVTASNVELRNNVYETNQNAIVANNITNLVVTGNIFKNVTTALYSLQIEGLVFVNNTVNSAANALSIEKLYGLVEITDNQIKNITNSAIVLNFVDTKELFVSRNEFVNVNETAILVKGYKPTELVSNVNVLYNDFNLVQTALSFDAHTSLSEPKNQYLSFSISYNNFNVVKSDIVVNNQPGKVETVEIYRNTSTDAMNVSINGYESTYDNAEWFIETPLYNEVVKENLIYPLYAYVDEEVHADLYAASKLEISFYPARSNVTEVYYVSSNESILKFNEDGKMEGLKKGVVQVKAYFKHNDQLAAEFDVRVDVPERVEVRYEDQSWVQESFDILLTATLEGTDESKEIIWSSSDESIATVDNGRVTGVKEGIAYITATAKGTNLSMTVGVTIVGELDEATKYVLEQNNANIYVQTSIDVTGYQFVYKHDIYSSVSKLYLNENPIIEAIVGLDQSNRPGTKKTSVEFVTVHDTASSAASANGLAHANYVQQGGGGTSWHYTTANDGIYHHIPDDEVAYHAGDGTSVKFGLLKTNVKVQATTEVKITIDQVTGNYLINNQDTGLQAPRDNGNIIPNHKINDCGIHYVVGDDGYYYLGKTYYNGTYQKVSNYGGNNNSIGIETCVNTGSDLYLTWQKTANLVAKLLIENDLDLTRVKPHHFFSGKNCPQTMRDNSLYYEHFLYLVAAEYNFMKEYSGCKVMGRSNSLDYVSDNGRVKVQPLYSESVSYDVIISNGETSTTITLFSVIPGQYCNK